jgi:hypothetical protein
MTDRERLKLVLKVAYRKHGPVTQMQAERLWDEVLDARHEEFERELDRLESPCSGP